MEFPLRIEPYCEVYMKTCWAGCNIVDANGDVVARFHTSVKEKIGTEVENAKNFVEDVIRMHEQVQAVFELEEWQDINRTFTPVELSKNTPGWVDN